MSDTKQLPLLEAEASWFHIFRAMIHTGEAKDIGADALFVYLVIKSYTNWATGKSRPEIELIIEKTGFSKRTVLRALAKLESHGYLTKEKVGRKSVYTLREKIQIQDNEGRPAATATFDYLPGVVRDATAEIKRFCMTGKGGTIIQIENLTVNIQQIFENHGEVSQDNRRLNLDDLPDSAFKRALEAHKKKLDEQ